ncbi:crotonobetainyl-CoA:carnitine CoA-transferase CaiB-like acyl-CoA transferase [Nocardioides daedukensis]|uniref:Crotonobetainyl-CoA:carnitine CoA-transferase CaiB-like acyl-CoA transferase n=1 Tax=Nocardioides daedukensis TaxID=634462 RepID=A0A7Y9S4H2_9ACTN|nr:CoA transferase [Nocardioides daedukensis]NYG59559.1 crotonobetainyl-CoA:carnitine CoA-transferase CaiB-like acyl-CoA transferase [Nocardioides daedukensis]
MTGARVMNGASPLASLTVVELAQSPAGEQTGKCIADLGAHVQKVEPPGGVASRHTGPWAHGQEDPDQSLEFWAYNSSKNSRVIDGSSEEDRLRFAELLADAQVLIVEDRGWLLELGVDLDELLVQRPDLIVVSVTPFGLTGPWKDYRTSDLVALAAGGTLNSCGYDDHSIPPIRPGGNQGFQLGASFSWCGLLLALIERERTGRGQLVDVSVHESNAVSGELANPYWFYPKAIVQRQTCRHAQPEPTQPALFECGDGNYVYFALILAEHKAWKSLLGWMTDLDMAADLTDPAYDEIAHRQQQFSHIQELIEVFFLIQDADTIYHEGQRRGLPIGRLNAFEDLPHDVHLQERGFFVDLPTPDGDTVTYPGLPYRFTSFQTAPGRPPRLGEHDEPARSAHSGGADHG